MLNMLNMLNMFYMLRKLTGIKDTFGKYEYEHLIGWYILTATYTGFLNWNKIFDKIK